jgi:hypothetical protein
MRLAVLPLTQSRVGYIRKQSDELSAAANFADTVKDKRLRAETLWTIAGQFRRPTGGIRPIQLAFLPNLQQKKPRVRGARVLIVVPKGLRQVLRDLEGVDVFIDSMAQVDHVDCHAGILDLPGIFRTSLENIPICASPFQP